MTHHSSIITLPSVLRRLVFRERATRPKPAVPTKSRAADWTASAAKGDSAPLAGINWSLVDKPFTVLALSVGAVLLLVFTADLATGFPFNRVSLTMDIGWIISSLLLVCISWDTWRNLR